MRITIFILTLFPFFSFAQWERPTELPQQQYWMSFEHQGTYFTGSDSILYYRENTQASWSILKTFPKPVFFTKTLTWNGQIYFGTERGLFVFNEAENTWEPPLLSNVHISDIAVYENTIWVSTLGSGVYQWVTPEERFKRISGGMYAQNISRLLVWSSELYAFTEANGVFYHYQKEINQWESRFHFGELMPEFGAFDAIVFQDKMWVSSFNAFTYRQENSEKNWYQVSDGLPRGMNSLFYKTEDQLFLLVNTRAYSCRIFVLLNDQWQECTEELKGAYAYGFTRLGSSFYLSTDQGLFFWSESLLGEKPTPHENQKWIRTNPLNHSMLELSSHSNVEKAEIYSLNGGLLWQKEYPKSQEMVNMPNGMYILHIYTKGRTFQEKLLIKN